MIVLGLTGPSGGGKGYVCRRLIVRGIPCVDTDAIVHRLYTSGSPCAADLADAFGPTVLSPDGSVDRRALSAIVFADPRRLETLNATVHRYVLDEVRHWLAKMESNGQKIAVVDAPQLFESGFDRECGYTLAVLADSTTRLSRLKARDGLPEEQILNRMRNQHDDAFFEANCDFIIRNDGTENVDSQIDAILSAIDRAEGEP